MMGFYLGVFTVKKWIEQAYRLLRRIISFIYGDGSKQEDIFFTSSILPASLSAREQAETLPSLSAGVVGDIFNTHERRSINLQGLQPETFTIKKSSFFSELRKRTITGSFREKGEDL